MKDDTSDCQEISTEKVKVLVWQLSFALSQQNDSNADCVTRHLFCLGVLWPENLDGATKGHNEKSVGWMTGHPCCPWNISGFLCFLSQCSFQKKRGSLVFFQPAERSFFLSFEIQSSVSWLSQTKLLFPLLHPMGLLLLLEPLSLHEIIINGN